MQVIALVVLGGGGANLDVASNDVLILLESEPRVEVQGGRTRTALRGGEPHCYPCVGRMGRGAGPRHGEDGDGSGGGDHPQMSARLVQAAWI